jgi:hypothetical protein
MSVALEASRVRTPEEDTLLDSQHWRVARATGTLPFHLDGDAIPASRTNLRRTWISTAEGVVTRVERQAIVIDGEPAVSLKHSITASFDLGALVGGRVRVTLLNVATHDSGLTQTLTVTGEGGDLLVLGHSGEAKAVSHTLGDLDVYVALSQRPGGPMVFGTARLQSIVREGEHIRVRSANASYVMELESRRGREATYAIGAEDLWRGPPSTLRGD